MKAGTSSALAKVTAPKPTSAAKRPAAMNGTPKRPGMSPLSRTLSRPEGSWSNHQVMVRLSGRTASTRHGRMKSIAC